MTCLNCEHISVSKTHCPYAQSLYGKEMKIEDPNKIPEWCPKESKVHALKSSNKILQNIAKRVQNEKKINPPTHYSKMHHRHSRR